jgi:hypothetical protein
MPSSQRVQSAFDLNGYTLTGAQQYVVVDYLMQFAVDGQNNHTPGSGDIGYVINDSNGADTWNVTPYLAQVNTLSIYYPMTGSSFGVVDQSMIPQADSYVAPYAAYSADHGIYETSNAAHDPTNASQSPPDSFQSPAFSTADSPIGVPESPPSDNFGLCTHNAGPLPSVQDVMPGVQVGKQSPYDPRAMFWDPLSFKHMSGAFMDPEDVVESNYANLQNY